MTLHPIAVVDHVLGEYQSYLSTEFRARDETLRQALEEALEQPRFLAQDPFFQAHRPFKDGLRWEELGLDAALAKVMRDRARSEQAYLHQSDAIQHLLSAQASPLVVTTGTGSGKTECFLLPVIQNAIEDAVRFKRSGLTAILVYPMNALANDQEARIRDYLESSGHRHVSVARYDRSTKQEERARLRKDPPRILLTNYMMLEYLLVRPADRDGLFQNHRCRFVVLDEVHSYRGTLGSNIALLFRRLCAHLRRARQDWAADDRANPRRFPSIVPVATSATIKSVDERGKTREEVTRLRDEAVQEFLGKLTGYPGEEFRVIGESLRDLEVPPEARWPAQVVDIDPPDHRDEKSVHGALLALAGAEPGASRDEAARRAGVLWKLGELLARRPLSLEGIVEAIRSEVEERREADVAAVRKEVEAALITGAALPATTPGALRLRTHRFLRGGWRFYRCVDPGCGRLYPMGEEQCSCGKLTAPLLVCRSCGADGLHFWSESDGADGDLSPNRNRRIEGEWTLIDRGRFPDPDDDGDGGQSVSQMKGRPVVHGSFDPATCSFSADEGTYPVRVTLAPARNRCLVCGATAGAHNVLTPVALGTSAAVRVVSEGLVEALTRENRSKEGHDGKERLLVFSDSRQDAAHQARFITYAGRYDRMRRRLVRALGDAEKPFTLSEAVTELLHLGVSRGDNPRCERFDNVEYMPDAVRNLAEAWEEAPLLDDLAITAGYRATVFNLGLVGIRYQHLEKYVSDRGGELAQSLGVSERALAHLARCLLDEMRRNGALSRGLLTYHPGHPRCPDEYSWAADWERRLKSPSGYACDGQGAPIGYLDRSEVPDGIALRNFWRKEKGGGRPPGLQRRFQELLKKMGGVLGTEDLLMDLLKFLTGGPRLIDAQTLYGFRKSARLLQVNADCVQLVLLRDEDRYRCGVCHVRMPWVSEGDPCPACHGSFAHWPAEELGRNRYVQRIRSSSLSPLVAGEHTAQIAADERIELEERFKGPPDRSPLNVLACSPTLEMGIDVGGLDAVVMRNVPPRPDNYAQRGGRAGRRERVGIVLGYARSTPHDGYFYDKPEEMIAGEVPAPSVGLGNRDVVRRHLHAIVFGGADPGLAGKMAEYISLQGEVQEETVDELVSALESRFADAVTTALEAWGADILEPAGLATRESLLEELRRLPDLTRDVFGRVRKQLIDLEQAIRSWQETGRGDRSAVQAMELKRRLLGIRSDRDTAGAEADDRTQGHPMRRFAEFGILPGYEFPSEPCTLRLLRDSHEEEPVSVERRFGIAQYQPGARAHARGHRWRVVGLDMSSPWNPKSPDPDWVYAVCLRCKLRYGYQSHVECPRCGSGETMAAAVPAHEFGGFVAVRDDTPVLEEEDRFAIASLVQQHPQWDGEIVRRYLLPPGWRSELRRGEEIRWVNEWKRPTPAEAKAGIPMLHGDSRGFYLCPHCGKSLSVPLEGDGKTKKKGRKKPRRRRDADEYGHAPGCPRQGETPVPCAIVTKSLSTTLRVVVTLPADMTEASYERWGHSLGYALRTGIRQLYMLDGPEIEFVLESMWESHGQEGRTKNGALTFIDPAVGGSGYLDRAAAELHLVAGRTLEHLDHEGCQSACYRCLKSYNNQRHHEHLFWPGIQLDLEQLAQEAPRALAAERGDLDDSRVWLEAYDAGVGSPLELRFLRLFEKHGVEVDPQVPVAPSPEERPISLADFVLRGRRVAIYVDGAAFHKGDRLRRDRFIRKRLEEGEPGWSVVELRAADLGRAEEVVSRIREAADRRP